MADNGSNAQVDEMNRDINIREAVEVFQNMEVQYKYSQGLTSTPHSTTIVSGNQDRLKSDNTKGKALGDGGSIVL